MLGGRITKPAQAAHLSIVVLPLTNLSGEGLKALHTLSAYATNARLTFAQLSVPEKTNEITAMPDLLDQLAQAKQLKGALVTVDAMGCQVGIADKIVAHGADYLLGLKGNQPIVEGDVAIYFDTAPETELATKTTIEQGHGRIETRAYAASVSPIEGFAKQVYMVKHVRGRRLAADQRQPAG